MKIFMWYALLSLSCDGMERITENQTNEIYTKLFRNDKHDVDSSKKVYITYTHNKSNIYISTDSKENFVP